MTTSLGGRLVLLTLAVLIPALATAAVLLWDAYRQERGSVERQIMETARALSLVVDRQIGQQQMMLKALATSPYVASGDWKAFHAQARRATEGLESWVVVADSDGQQLVNSRVPWETVLPTTRDNRKMSWATAPNAKFRVSNLFVGAVAQRPIIIVEVDVVRPDGSRYTMDVGTRVRSFDAIWRDQRFPPTWIGSVLDGNLRMVARSQNIEKFLGAAPSEMLLARARKAPSGVMRNQTREGVDSLVAWSRAPDFGWIFVVAVPASEIAGSAQRSLIWGFGVGAALLALGVLLAAWVARSIARPVGKLAGAARAWGRGEAVRFAPTGMVETDQLGAAFAGAAQAAVSNEAELQRRVEERTHELAEMTESLVQAQKLEAVGRLTGGIAHDFNNLLMAVTGNLELLERRLTDGKLSRYVDQARQAAERGAKLTAQLLAFSRRQRLEPKPIDVNDAVTAAANLLSSALGGAVTVETALAPDLWPGLADVTQLELVILNLAINARDAMPQGGVITIQTSNAVATGQTGRAEAPPAGEFVMICVSDTGTGMTPDVAARVFEPFFTTKPVGEGSGLGLPQVLGLAKQLGGGVELITAPGEGASFKIYLPRTQTGSVSGAAEPPTAEAAPPSLAGVRILLVDDDTQVRSVAGAILREAGCEVMEAATGFAALDLIDGGAQIDLALLDFAMPALNGGEAAQLLRDRRPGLPVILMSGYADAEALARVWTGPLLHKPFSASQLARLISQALAEAAEPMRRVTG
ncbi:MAG: ATP-binding protein [Caulobacteraceae bacterium]